MSRPKKTPALPAPPVPPRAAAKKTAAAPRKTSAIKASAPAPASTVEAVAARLLTFPHSEDGTPALWRKEDFAAELTRLEKPHLDAALARLQAERRVVALSYGQRGYFVFAAALDGCLGGAPVAVSSVPDPAAGDLMAVYRRLVRESGGFPDVKIAQLARGIGAVAARGLPEKLIALWRSGDATLSLGDWSLASEETRAAAVEMDGEKYLLVRFAEA